MIVDPELESMSDEFIQSQIDYFNKLSGTKEYWFGRCYRDEKYRREQLKENNNGASDKS